MTTTAKKPTKASTATAPATNTATDATTTEGSASTTSTQLDGNETGTTAALATAGAGEHAPAAGDADPQVFELGVTQGANADALAELLEGSDFPLKVQVVNVMPRPVFFPELQGLTLGHVAGTPESKTGTAVFRDVDQLHRFATDVQALCEFNEFKRGVQLTVL